MKERRTARKAESLAGQLLLAHPALRDPNFKRTVILLSAHSGDGSMGVVLNRPLDKQLGEVNAGFAFGPLAGVPVYAGGPVEPGQLVIVSWQWLEADHAFQLHFGLEPDKALELVGSPGVTLRAFLGYAGWSKGQLENELKHDTWLVSAVEGEMLGQSDGVALWRQILGSIDPELKLMADEPDDPSVN
ncbi:YqgE/AlgH family protein [Opitutus sp. GAS368]|jgi:putative transcriptional regulator|uniref:YqgE/AlgH family protein n=1 Tax=Opitutus sp. GAS368 TaxID=1882749 RepID=UPI00087C88A0|nr:YqgE/AlgH family protein [Opitutus sp. GAS368]SDS65223.1 putative transcriptional regulator [Opitutus sp. GAS368]